MKGWLQVVFAVAVITGWFLFALYIIATAMQIGVVQQSTSCTVDAALDVSCHR